MSPEECERWARREWRKPSKRAYAVAWAMFRNGHVADEPVRPDDLSYMAAQAVRLHYATTFDGAVGYESL